MLRGLASPPIVLICEGGTDTLAASLLCAPHVPRAILGVGSGAWTEEHAEQIPPHAEVVIATDPDPAGDKYAERIEATLQGRGLSMRVRRANLSADVRDTLTRRAARGG
jgi:5S rRNA maturation endonuclease (ribonuclease M5)